MTGGRGRALLPAPPFRSGSPWVSMLVVSVLTVPFVIMALALVPALMTCPLLHEDHQRLILRLLAASVDGPKRSPAPHAATPCSRRIDRQLRATVGSPRGISPRGSHGTERDRLQSFRSSHPLHRYARIQAQCAKSSGSLSVSPRHQALNRFHVRSRLYFLRAHRIKCPFRGGVGLPV